MSFVVFSLMGGLFLATFVSEDAACAFGGLLASQGRLSLLLAIIGCGLGIFASDLAIIFAGRAVARGAKSRWTRWLSPSAEKLERAERWFDRHGLWVVLASRFIPGTRSATCFAAGLLRVPMKKFALVFFAASAVWTPVAVGAVYSAARATSSSSVALSRGAVILGLVVLAALALGFRLIRAATTWRGRRLLLSRWRRLTRWEFWPSWALYTPVALYLAWLSLRFRSLTLFTAVNPGMPAGGGLKGESKSEILRGLSGAGDVVAKWIRLDPASPEERFRAVREFMATEGLEYPVVLKPDVGERGQGVVIAKSDADVRAALAAEPGALIAQAYVPGVEFGVFYFRRPSEQRGQIFAITVKRMTAVVGDGRHTLEALILADDRAVCQAPLFLAQHATRLNETPANGEVVPLTQLGTHCRGALFLDGSALETTELTEAIDRVSRRYDGFYFGRYDVRSPSAAAFQSGQFTVIELNGLTSEATSIYDPRHSVFFGWRTLCRQWRLAMEIAAENRARGHAPLSVSSTLRLLRAEKSSPAPATQPHTVREDRASEVGRVVSLDRLGTMSLSNRPNAPVGYEPT